ncbi:MAG: hypothetical protein AB7E85_00705 [Pseudobdellovibrionaceae bacterium]
MALDQSRAKKIGIISAILIPLLLVLFLVGYLVFFAEQPYPVTYYPAEESPAEIILEEDRADAPSEEAVIEEKVEATEEAVTVDSASEE